MRYRRYIRAVVFIFFIFITTSFCWGDEALKPAPPQAVRGIIDLTSWDFEKDGPVELNGEYEFYWQQHLYPSDFSSDPWPEPTAFIKTPGFWKDLNIEGQPLPGIGYATYRLTILVKERRLPLALMLLDCGTAFTLYLNGRKACMVGIPGQLAETTVPHYFPQVIDFTNETEQVELIFQVSNFHHRRGGLWDINKIGSEKAIRAEVERRLGFELVLFGSILIMTFYQLGLFILRTKNRAPLYFSLICLLGTIRILTTGSRYLTHIYPTITWELFMKLEYSWYLSIPAFALFIHSLFPEYSKRVLQVIIFTSVGFALVVLLTPARIFTQTLPAYQVITLITCIYGFYVLIRACLNKREGALLFLIGFVILVLTAVNDMLYVSTIIQTGNFVPFGVFIFIFAQSIIHSLRFSKAYQTVETQFKEMRQTYQAYRAEITDRLQAEEALRASEEKYRTILHSIEDGYYEVDLAGNLTFFNDALCRVLGYDRDTLTGMNNWRFMDKETAKRTYRIFNEVYRTGKAAKALEWETLRQDGTRSITEASVSLMRDPSGQAVGFRGLARDITELKQAQAQAKLNQEQLMRADKMVALGTLVSGVAHEINNPNNFIMLNASILNDAWRDALPILAQYYKENGDFLISGMPYTEMRHKLGDLFVGMSDGAKRIKQIVDDLKNYVRDDTVDLDQEVDLNSVLKSTISLVANMINKSTNRFDVAFCDNLPVLKGNFQRLEQVMINLIQNACQALPDNQTGIFVTITCDQDRSHVTLTVKDEGVGIDAETLPHITDPFFTTKFDAGGVGLGLSIAAMIVEEHGGTLRFASEPGQGTTAEVKLPLEQ